MQKVTAKYILSNLENPTHHKVVWDNIPPFVNGSTSNDKLQFICAFGGDGRTLFEFGTFIGRSALGFSQNYSKVVTIDCGPENTDIIYSYPTNVGALVTDIKNVTCLTGDSRKVDLSIFYGLFDVVYVDGNHTTEGAIKDIDTALKLTNEQGIVFVDDVMNDMLGVDKAVEHFENEAPYLIEDLRLVMFVK